MNPLNRASLESSLRLSEAGIVLKTEASWYYHYGGPVWTWELSNCWPTSNIGYRGKCIPAPSMAEVWRKLPRYIERKGYHYELLLMQEPDGFTSAHYSDLQRNYTIFRGDSINPTDALIDLLIWTRKGGANAPSR